MKKILCVGLAILLIGVAIAAYGETKVVVKDIITINVDKSLVRTDVPPIVVQGQTLVPARGVFNAFGAEIAWFPREKKVYIRENTKVIWLRIGDSHAKVNDNIVPLTVPAQIYRGRTMVPLRFIAEALGARVNWNPDKQTITITTRERAILTPEPPAPQAAPEYQTPAPSAPPMPAPNGPASPPDTSNDNNDEAN